ncbi:MAG: hypothetical protein ACYTFG_15640 [Planctomycetota bacterium]|jgi:hypothetical protein
METKHRQPTPKEVLRIQMAAGSAPRAAFIMLGFVLVLTLVGNIFLIHWFVKNDYDTGYYVALLIGDLIIGFVAGIAPGMAKRDAARASSVGSTAKVSTFSGLYKMERVTRQYSIERIGDKQVQIPWTWSFSLQEGQLYTVEAAPVESQDLAGERFNATNWVVLAMYGPSFDKRIDPTSRA